MSGDPELALVEYYLELSKNYFPSSGNGITVEIRPLESCCDEVVNPEDILKVFSHVASAAREVARQEYDDTSLTETVEFLLAFDVSVDLEKMEEAFEYMGQMFISVMVSQK